MVQSVKVELVKPELFFGLVGAIGTNLTLIEVLLKEALSEVAYECEIIRLSELLPNTADPTNSLTEKYTQKMKAGTDLRNELKRGDAVVLLGLSKVWEIRGQKAKTKKSTDCPDCGEEVVCKICKLQLPPTEASNICECGASVTCDVCTIMNDFSSDVAKPIEGQAYVFHSLKHPAEAETLRKVYGNSFFLVAGYSPREQRVSHLAKSIASSRHVFQAQGNRKDAEELIERDRNETGEKLGQRVQDTFPEADVFIDVTDPKAAKEAVKRFVELLFAHPFHTPTRDENAMFHARAAALRSSDLGRQVGAVICTPEGDITTTGTNEVPKAGGGQYWPKDEPDRRNFEVGYDSNDTFKSFLLQDLMSRLLKDGWLGAKTEPEIKNYLDDAVFNKTSNLSGAQIMGLIAFFRAVHAEMSCITDAARRGIPTRGNTLVCTTFPCHECARHIVAAGIYRVVYIDPYPKSLAPDLYPDSIVVDTGEGSSTHVSFEPFVGIAPRLFMTLFDASKIERKTADGFPVKWNPTTARPRITEFAEAYLLQESKHIPFLNDLGGQEIKDEPK